jgi:hypothetical protein
MRPRVRAWLQHPCGHPPTPIKLSALMFHHIMISVCVIYNYLAISCLFYLFLLVLCLLAGRVPLWLGCRAPQDCDDHWSWCISCIGAASLDGCSRDVNFDSFLNRVIHLSPSKDRDCTLTRLHQVVSRARLIGVSMTILAEKASGLFLGLFVWWVIHLI